EIDSLKEGKVVFKNESYAYSQYYHYSQIIYVNQPSPIVNCKFQKFNTSQIIIPKFPFKFYGSNVTIFDISQYSKRIIYFELKYLLSFVYSHFISRMKVALISSENQFHAVV
ncbi:hypothetical protein Smp_191400, partial [Schistosoma mansoni]|uniref:hypothetical protein n=1 Tax=Schistosoma mansoni TaxID=6183 RepID=UPI00022C86D7